MRSIIPALVLLTTIVAGQEPTLILYSDDACATELASYPGYNYESCSTPATGALSYQITNSEDASCDQAQEYYTFALYGNNDCSGDGTAGQGGCYVSCTSLSGTTFESFEVSETMLEC